MPSNDDQMNSRSYTLAVNDAEFLLRDEMRPLRFAIEFGKPELLLRDWGVRSTVVVFGSARIPSPEQAEELMRNAVGRDAMKKAKARASLVRWYQEARRFGRIVSERGGAITSNSKLRDNVIATGGGPGIMEAANRGAMEAGAPSIGFNISLPAEQEPNSYSTPALTFRFHYFAMRKMHLAMRANALAVFPGGFGTMDELFEILTLQQTRKSPSMPVLLFGREFWKKAIDFDALMACGMVEPEDLDLFEIVDDAEEALNAMLRRGLTAHTPR